MDMHRGSLILPKDWPSISRVRKMISDYGYKLGDCWNLDVIFEDMKKIKLILEYDGTAYHGWQVQKKGLLTIQGVLEDRIFRITGERSRVVGASRTDAGVHAFGQVAAFSTVSDLSVAKLKRALNAMLPQDIRVLHATEIEESFHPRQSAIKKRYFYVISNQEESSAFLFRYSWLVKHHLDLTQVKEAARALIGIHDFSSFMGTGSSIKNPEREIFLVNVEKLKQIDFMTMSLKGKFIKISIEANGFLRHMVRNIIGTLVEIGRGKFSADKMQEILRTRDRRLAGPTAPSNGLFLERIIY
ncbi:MAG: tRNA pseudouridine(38-40) synthase TruA [Nitrospirota bacterium]